jgi:signal transduction histidine kinase
MGLMDNPTGIPFQFSAHSTWLLVLLAFVGMAVFAVLWWRLHRRQADLVQSRNDLLAEVGALRAEMEAERRAEDARQTAMETLLRAREAAEQADHNKTRFLAAAGHDLRQPLQALGLFVTALAHRPLPDDLRAIVDKIESSLEALEHLLDTLLDISRLDAGVIEAHVTTFAVQALFDRMAFEFVPLAEKKGLSLRVVATRAITRSDPALLERILRNLLSNAIRYTRQGGVVAGCRRRGGDLRIEVWDSGSGIAPANQREIFLEFRRFHEGEGEDRHGLGLGLAIVERLAALLDLRIELESTVGRGSVFAVVLPNASVPAVSHPALTTP